MPDRSGYPPPSSISAKSAKEKPCEIVTCCGFARALTGADDPSIREYHLQAEHVFAHGAITNGHRARTARRSHAAQRCIRTRVNRKKRPLPCNCAFNCLRVTPGSTRQSRSLTLTSITRFMLPRSTQTPPKTAAILPSRDVPTPYGINGVPEAAHRRTISTTSSLDRGNTTASGGCGV